MNNSFEFAQQIHDELGRVIKEEMEDMIEEHIFEMLPHMANHSQTIGDIFGSNCARLVKLWKQNFDTMMELDNLN